MESSQACCLPLREAKERLKPKSHKAIHGTCALGFSHARVLLQPHAELLLELWEGSKTPGQNPDPGKKQFAVTCLVLSLPCQYFYAMRISFSTFLSLTCLYFLCFLFCTGGRRTRFLWEMTAVVNDGEKPAKTEGRAYSEGKLGHAGVPFPTHCHQRAL